MDGKIYIDEDYDIKGGWFKNNSYNTFTKITTEELQAEFNKLGYEYDFETHTAKKMEWKPKCSDIIWYIHPISKKIDNGLYREFDMNKGVGLLHFRTKKLAEAALETLKNLPHA